MKIMSVGLKRHASSDICPWCENEFDESPLDGEEKVEWQGETYHAVCKREAERLQGLQAKEDRETDPQMQNELLDKMNKATVKTSQSLELVRTMGDLDDRELSRALRDALIAEEIAIQQYENIADSTSDERVKDVVQEIANEEKVHVGELQKLLVDMLKDEQGFLDEGAKEVEDKQ